MRRTQNLFRFAVGQQSVSGIFDRRLARTGLDHRQGEVRSFNRENQLTRLLTGLPIKDQPRYSEYTHVSDLINKCARARGIFLKQGGHLITRNLSDSDFVTFAIGNAIHDMVKDRAIYRRPSEIYAQWKCNCKQFQIVGTYQEAQQARVCETCGSKAKNYYELVVSNSQYEIIGSPDLLFLTNTYFYAGEIKSIAKKAWEDLTRAKPDHIIQILFYWWLLREARYNVFDQVSILYVCKDYRFGSPFKEYTIRPSQHIQRLNPYLIDAMAIKEAKNGGALPVRVECGDRSAPKARVCQFATTCFGVRE